MRNTVKSQLQYPVQDGNESVYVDSDRYFNGKDKGIFQAFEGMGMDIQPVDVFGGFVPQDKSLSNLKKCEKAIRTRFSLGE